MSGTVSRRDFLTRSGGALAGVYVLGLVGCGGGGGGAETRVRFSWWGNQQINERTRDMIELFRKAHADVTVDGEYTDIGGYFEKLATQTAGRNAPDLFEMNYPSLAQYASNGTTLDLGPFTGKQLKLDGYDDAAAETGKIDGKLVAVPFGITAQGVYCDADAFKRAGLQVPDAWTWDEHAEQAKAISEASEDGFYGTGDHGGFDQFLQLYLRSHGVEMYTAEGKLGFAKDDLADWLDYWDRMRKSGAAVPGQFTAEGGPALDDAPLIRGKAAMRMGGANGFASASQLTKNKLALAGVPTADDGSTGQFPRPSSSLCVYGGAGAEETAVTLMNFLLNDVEARKVLGVARSVPASAPVRDALLAAAKPVDKRVIEFTTAATKGATTPPPPPPGAGEITTLLERANQDVALKQASVSKAVDEFMSEAERAISS